MNVHRRIDSSWVYWTTLGNHINIIIVQQLSNMYLHKVKKWFSHAAKLQLIAISLRGSFLYFTSIRSSQFIYFTWCTYISDADKLPVHSMDSTTENHHIGCNSENVFTWFNAIFSQTQDTLGNQTTNEMLFLTNELAKKAEITILPARE